MTAQKEILNSYSTITLEEMKDVRLMNRIDTKFVTTESNLDKLLQLAASHYRVQIIDGYAIMPYHTVYYDTVQASMYTAHLHGKLTRQKVRVREYENDGTAFLEIKLKNNKGRTRKKRVLHNVPEVEKREFLEKWSAHSYDSLSPIMENRFNRITLVNHSATERITIDTSLRFHNFRTGMSSDLTGLVIIEVKRDGRSKSDVSELLRQLRIKPSGFSKYCMGMALTDPSLPANRFKPRLRMIDKFLKIHNNQY